MGPQPPLAVLPALDLERGNPHRLGVLLPHPAQRIQDLHGVLTPSRGHHPSRRGGDRGSRPRQPDRVDESLNGSPLPATLTDQAVLLLGRSSDLTVADSNTGRLQAAPFIFENIVDDI